MRATSNGLNYLPFIYEFSVLGCKFNLLSSILRRVALQPTLELEPRHHLVITKWGMHHDQKQLRLEYPG